MRQILHRRTPAAYDFPKTRVYLDPNDRGGIGVSCHFLGSRLLTGSNFDVSLKENHFSKRN
jgi:hypothetical protein